jgi:hypothetical protein
VYTNSTYNEVLLKQCIVNIAELDVYAKQCILIYSAILGIAEVYRRHYAMKIPVNTVLDKE